jgi:hypothetical protein
MPPLRLLVTLDEDLVAALRDDARTRGVSFDAMIDEALRRGLARSRHHEPYRLETASMGPPSVDLTNASQVAAEMEDDELLRRLSRGD